MSVKLGSNIASLLAQRRLSNTTSSLAKTFERLSSGLRINSPSDDAAGLSLAESLKSDVRVYTQAVRNVNDGISLLNIASSALESLTGIVSRLKELSSQAANGTLNLSQRSALDAEAQALSDEYFRIAQTTKFNGKSLFSSSFGNLTLQAGYGSSGNLTSSLGGAVGTGQFGTGIDTTTSATNRAYGDFNGDGNLDVVAATNTYLEIFLGTGQGTFASAISIASGDTTVYDVQVGDINGDGSLDIVTSGFASATNNVRVRLGNGDGSFDASVSYTGGTARTIAIGDMDNDGYDDVVFSDISSGRATVRLGQSDGSLSAGITTAGVNSSTVNKVLLGDLDNDGALDFLILHYSASGASNAFSTALGNGDGTFGSVTSFESGSEALTGDLADLDNDGILDIVAFANVEGFHIRRGLGDGTFGAAEQIDTSLPADIETADINGDGNMDIIASRNTTGTTYLYTGDGSGSFTQTSTISGIDTELYADDFNNDGVADILGQDAPTLSISVALGTTTSGVGPLLPFSLKGISDAKMALSRFDQKLNQLTAQQGTIGAFMSRTEFASSHLQSLADNSQAAASRINDADVAGEAAELVRLQILQQAATAVLAQANLQPQIAIRLLSPST